MSDATKLNPMQARNNLKNRVPALQAAAKALLAATHALAVEGINDEANDTAELDAMGQITEALRVVTEQVKGTNECVLQLSGDAQGSANGIDLARVNELRAVHRLDPLTSEDVALRQSERWRDEQLRLRGYTV